MVPSSKTRPPNIKISSSTNFSTGQAYDPQICVSIALPVYNGEAYLVATLDSIVAQSHLQIELAIIDDASTDGSAAILQRYADADPRITLYRNTKTLGMVANWNRVISHCRGDWVLLMGQDDLLEPEMIETALRQALPETDLVMVARRFLFESSVDPLLRETLQKDLPTLKQLGLGPGIVTPDRIAKVIPKLPSPSTNFLGEPVCGLVRRPLFERLGGYHPRLTQLADYEFWLRIALQQPMIAISEQLATFRVHGESQTSANRRIPIRGVFLESALLMQELLEGTAYAKIRAAYPQLCPIWKTQLNLDTWAILHQVNQEPDAVEHMNTLRRQHPELSAALSRDRSFRSFFAYAWAFFRTQWRHAHPGRILRRIQRRWA
jgi:glycosyltransferase involved in cell wall biosynthesis